MAVRHEGELAKEFNNMVEETKTAESPEKGDTGGKEEKLFKQSEVDALLQKEVELRKVAERATTEHAKRFKEVEASRSEWQSEIQGLRQEMQIFAALQAEGRSPEEAEGLEPKEKGNLLAKFQLMQQQNEARRVGDKYRQRAEALGLTEADDDYWTIYSHVERGRLQAADAKLKRLEQAKAIQEVAAPEIRPKETEEERIERLAEEKARKIFEEAGVLVQDTGAPSGGAGKRWYTEEEIGDRAFYLANKANILQAYQEGRIKPTK